MMKGSTNTQSTMPQNTGFQNAGIQNTGPQNAGLGNNSILLGMLNFMSPALAKKVSAGSGTKGSMQPQEQRMSVPAMPQYTNYQQMPVYSSQPAAPSDAIMRFMSGYASGGNVKTNASDSIEDDIKAALRLARLIGELTKKE